jgi:CelD/BcsL family acetyltransferase involved in cellulose biosynthesis
MLEPASRAPGGLTFSAFGSLQAVEPAWRALEASGLGSPYQRFDWVKAWQESHGAGGCEISVLVARDDSAAPVVVLPVVIERIGPARVARLPGGKHANFGMPWIDRSFARRTRSPEAASVLFGLAAAQGGIDVLAFANQPLERDGVANPFAALAVSRETPELACTTLIEGHGAGIVDLVVSKDSRKKFAKKRRWLAERGPLAHRRVRDAAEACIVLDAFLRQKARRSAARGLPNPFAEPAVQDFLRRACLAGLEHGAPAIELHALWSGDDPVATFGAVCHDGWLSGCFIAHEPDPALERSSPGELLLVEVLREAGCRGLASFDLGAGGGAYKASFCRTPLALTDTYLPITWIGRAAAPVLAGAGQLKAAVKKDPRIVAMLHRVSPRRNLG